MAVAYSSVSSEAEANGTLTITRPSVAADDLMIAFVFATNSLSISITPPSGWTLLASYAPNTSLVSAAWVYYKVAGGSESSTYDWVLSGGSPNNRSTGRIIVVTGADTTTPIDVSATDLDTTAGLSQVNPSVTTTVANTLLIWYTMEWGNQSTSTTWTPDAATTEAFEDTQAPAGGGHAVAYESVAAIGATGTRTWTTNQNRRSWNLSFAIKPAAGGGGSIVGPGLMSSPLLSGRLLRGLVR